ncbi:hypothetical protein CO009_03780 [Candidatus Shapirobacteria bacterium CG_4_8_14_3_um_filter_35_11]|uniref:Uncharacterized protein n=2 Tax=Candidatus Shapironibacteriota TaxID=1752721 RepID=A0A2M7BN02_9BACT|nr:MAG: hypothetical protein COS53_03605 [Candidatus Shapirobacteria bacterium CG03_land_8_20_14_0_80_35_14]PJC79706.1 MAG: hypothetical protein CO009_03780 [Candidatus Shapirobacteria bacterium CG_4_8_14_3_um_filter_35_11]
MPLDPEKVNKLLADKALIESLSISRLSELLPFDEVMKIAVSRDGYENRHNYAPTPPDVMRLPRLRFLGEEDLIASAKAMAISSFRD